MTQTTFTTLRKRRESFESTERGFWSNGLWDQGVLGMGSMIDDMYGTVMIVAARTVKEICVIESLAFAVH
jgi:hypothetical protein